MNHEGTERRRHPRITGRFIVSYRILDENNTDVTQSKNISAGGMLLTTNRQFARNTHLAVEIRLPFERNPIMLIGKVIDSCEITKDLIYDTRLEFLAVDENHRGILNRTVGYYLKKTPS
ncbi:MAG: PilZ domain-containing protein [Deltaproteobacteria bacterium]